VQEQLSELAQQIVHVIEACNEEKDFLKEEFNSVRNGIGIMERRLQMEKIRIDSEICGVGTMAKFQQAMLQELRSGIHVLQSQHNQIVQEATDLFSGMRQELEAQSKKISDNTLQLLVVLETVPDRHFGSGSGSEPNHCQTGGPGCQHTRTVDSGTVRCKSTNPSGLGGLSAGRTAGPSVDLYNVLVFAVA